MPANLSIPAPLNPRSAFTIAVSLLGCAVCPRPAVRSRS
jgi:hypothetical protein